MELIEFMRNIVCAISDTLVTGSQTLGEKLALPSASRN